MTTLVFYEKPGCAGNQQQKAELSAQGIVLEVRDLLERRWSSGELRSFFNALPVSEWFNLSAPIVKSGAIDVHACDEAQAMQLMIDEPLLIRRPLLQYGEIRQSGFVDGPVFDALGIRFSDGLDFQTCPMDDAQSPCEPPA
jgi:nitrogenase-associated protein